jgi:lysophospholipase L1-like esterase
MKVRTGVGVCVLVLAGSVLGAARKQPMPAPVRLPRVSPAAMTIAGPKAADPPAAASTALPGPSVVGRRPGPADGAPIYAQDEHWLDGDGRSWSMRDKGNGQTMWLYQEPAALPVDEIGGHRPIAAYGTKRLTAAYAGPAIDVVRASDGAALDIGFLQNGALDETLLAGFCASTECRVAKWYDQSGNGNDATQDAPIARPAVRLSHRTGNAVSLIWDFEMTSGAPPRFLVLPDGVAIDSAKMGMLWTGRFHNASMISPLVELGTDEDPFGFGFWDAHGDFYLGDAKHLGELPGHATVTPAIGLISASPDGTVANYRNHLIALGKPVSASHQGGFIGRTKAFDQYGMIELSSLILYARPLTPGERFYGIQAMSETFGIPQQQQDTYVVDGDSISQGIASLYLQSYQRDMERLLPPGFVLYDAAWAGKSLAGPGGLVERFRPFTSHLYNPHARNNILSILAGTNDLQNGEAGQDIFELLKRYAAAAKQAGFKVVVCSIMPRRTFTPKMEAERQRLNGLLISDWQDFADGFVDLASDPLLGPLAALDDHNVYITDGTHLTDYGYQTLANDMAQVVDRLIR